MYDSKKVRRRRAVLALLVGLCILLITASFTDAGPLGAIQRGTQEVLSPFQDGASRALKPARDFVDWVGDTLDAKSQLDQVKRRNARLQRQAMAGQAALRENPKLRAQLNLDSTKLSDYGPVSGRVISQSDTVWYSQIAINAGSGQGVGVGQAVVDGNDLVGKVSAVTSGSARVRLITDPKSGVSAAINRSNSPGVVQPAVGDPSDLVMSYLPRTSHVRRGDAVVTRGTTTSRLGEPVPPGLLIGRVSGVSENELRLDHRVHLTPAADLRRLNFVQVLTKPAGQHPDTRAQVTP